LIALAAALAIAAQADRAGNRIEDFQVTGPSPMEPSQGSGRHCSADRNWCAQIGHSDAGGWQLLIGGGAARATTIDLPPEDDNNFEYGLWPRFIRANDGSVLVGVEHYRTGAFSGGGWMTLHLLLFRVTADSATQVLEVPIESEAGIRACFNPQDRRRRRGLCDDRYSFAGTFDLAADNMDGPPVLHLVTVARTSPGRRSRTEDSTEAPPLRQRDLGVWIDPECSYTRSFRFDAAVGRYAPDSPVPSCDDYLDFG